MTYTLRKFIDNDNVEEIYNILDFENLAASIQEMISGFYGYYFMNHFIPYLQIKIETNKYIYTYIYMGFY